jgi:UDP-N-acetyl-2-amino-2-deoxyglucuronate dehydrogenase
VGIIDSFFPSASFFTEFERFDRHVEKLKREGEGKSVRYVSICSPNYMHDAHIRFALRVHADAICEKPLVLNPWNVDALAGIEKETGRRINTILQLRLHPAIAALRESIAKQPAGKIHDVDLTYITGRGNWYSYSWKGNEEKSGGIATNIGIHFFDMLTWIFGGVRVNRLHLSEPNRAAGYLELDRARVRWFLSLDTRDLPPEVLQEGKRTYRSIKIDGKELEFSEGFTDLHTRSYEQILKGRGFGLRDARSSIQTVHDIRHAKPVALTGDYHPLLKKNG